MIRSAIVTTAAAMLLGCAGSGPQHLTGAAPAQPAAKALPSPITLTKAQLSALHAGVRASLKDPESARFGTHTAGRDDDGTITVCGMVNARNSFGGYTGDKPYLASLPAKGPAIVIGMGGTDIQTKAVFQVCQQNGLAL